MSQSVMICVQIHWLRVYRSTDMLLPHNHNTTRILIVTKETATKFKETLWATIQYGYMDDG